MLFLAQSKEITVLYVMHDFDIGSIFIYIYDLQKSNDLVIRLFKSVIEDIR